MSISPVAQRRVAEGVEVCMFFFGCVTTLVGLAGHANRNTAVACSVSARRQRVV
jgi:hypothetical protein